MRKNLHECIITSYDVVFSGVLGFLLFFNDLDALSVHN